MNNLFVNQDTSSEILVSEEQSTQDLLYNSDKSEDILAPVHYEEYGLFAEQDNLKYIPLATKTTYGIVKIGDGLAVVNGVLSVVGGGGGSSNITKLSQLENDVGFVTNTTQNLTYYYTKTDVDNLLYDDTAVVNRLTSVEKNIINLDSNKANKSDLLNYYLKTDTYSKIEINELVSKIPKFGIEVEEDLDSIPEDERSTTTIYLVPKTDVDNNDYYDEVLWLDGAWERFGSVKANLSDYYTKSESNSNFINLTSIQNVSGRKNFKDISFERIFYAGEEDVLLMSASINSLSVGNKDVSISFISNSRPVLYEGVNLTRKELAYLSDIPDIPTKLSQLTNDTEFVTQQTLDLNYYNVGETDGAISAAIEKLHIPTKLSELSTDTNNQRVSVSEKTTWNNKSNFSGNYNDLSNKPNLSNYLSASSINDNITGQKVFIGSALQLAPAVGQQPTYIEVDENHNRFRVRGMWDFIYLDGNTDTIRLLGYDMARKEDIPDIPDTSDLVTTNTEQTIIAVKTIEGLKDKDGNDLFKTNGNYNYFNSLSKHLFLQSTQRPWLYIGNPNSYVRKEMAFTDDILTIDDIYPINSIYLTVGTEETGTASPASFLGGTWERLPEGYALWTSSSNAGTTISAGLPNITGSVFNNSVSGSTTGSGALYSKKEGSGAGGSTYNRGTIYFDASRSSSIYGASSTVQPPAYRVYAWKRIA